ncbi:MAG TPA: hypothetical protein VNK73_08345 [Actinomycetota bacterium]|jgi:uncharacterized protein YraI|nr:hypothetical protein [Actinomycetota bacterium]
MKRLARPLATALLVLGLMAGAIPAYASVNGDYGGSGIRIRTGPSTSRTVVGLGYRGQGATIYCITSGTSVGGNPWWLRHRNKTTGVTGYSADYYMTRPDASLPGC